MATRLADVLSLLKSFEYNGHIENVSSGHCPECMCFPDRPTTAQVWRDRKRVGHKPHCRRGKEFAAAYAALAKADKELSDRYVKSKKS